MNSDFELDFEGEFPPIKKLSREEADNVSLVKRLRLQRKLEQLEKSEDSKEYLNSEEILGQNRAQVTYVRKRRLSEGKDRRPISGKREILKSLVFTETGLSEASDNGNQSIPLGTEEDLQESANRSESSRLIPESDKVNHRSDKLKNLRLTEHGDNLILLVEDQRKSKDERKYYKDTNPINPQDLKKIRKRVLSQLTCRIENFYNMCLSPSMSDKYNEIYRLFEHTVRDFEGHSVLLFGPRSSGKTAMIEHALQNLSKKYSDQFITIRINASVHSDDSTALRDIARQLDHQAKSLFGGEEIEGLNVEQRSISDTFANILSILDRSANMTGNVDSEHAVPIIFVVDEFDKFTSGHRQTLLYNLFDLSQSSTIPICVVGISPKITTRELLEKRVRSRFSQRIIVLSKPSSVEEFWENARLGLIINNEFSSSLSDSESATKWNTYIDNMFGVDSFYFKKLVYQNYFTVKNYKDFNNNCIYAISKVNEETVYPRDEDFAFYASRQSHNDVETIINTLSALELLLLICAARWVEKFELHLINFNLAYKEYKESVTQFNLNSTTLSTSSSSTSSLIDNSILSHIKVNQRIWSPKALRSCWENLYTMGLLLDYGAVTTNADGHIISTTNSNKHIILDDTKMVQLDVTLDEIHNSMDDLNIFKPFTRL